MMTYNELADSTDWTYSEHRVVEPGRSWYVHRCGGNRPEKIAICHSKEEARLIADALNAYVRSADESPSTLVPDIRR